MKNLGNIFRIMGLVSAGLLLFGAGAHAASKQNMKQLTIKHHKVTKVERVTQKNVSLPHKAGGSGSMTFGLGLPKLTPTPNDLDRSGPTLPSENPNSLPENGYFMKKYIEANGAQGTVGEVAPIRGTPRNPIHDPALEEAIRNEIDKPNFEPHGSPADGLMDPFTLGCPGANGRPPGNIDELQEWQRRNRDSDIIGRKNSGSMGRANRDKMNDILSSGGRDSNGIGDSPGGIDPFDVGDVYEEADDYEQDGTENDENDGTDSSGEDDETMVFTEEEVGITDEEERDPEPEGDDPDEFRSPASVKAFNSPAVSTTPVMADRHQVASGFAGFGGEGKPGSSMPQAAPPGTGLPRLNHQPNPVDPEGGTPDTVGSPAVSQGVNSTMVGGYNYQPEPGGDDPDDPRASEGSVMAAGALGHAASPPVDGEGGGNPGPIGPEFSPFH